MVSRRKRRLDGSDPAHKGTGTKHSETGLAAGTTRSCRVRAVNAGGSGDWSGLAAATTERPQLTAAFEQVPAEHEGLDSTFTLRLVFSEAISAGYRTLRDQAITATDGAVRKAQRFGGSSAEWNVTVEPSSREAVTVSVSGGTDTCGQGDSVCTDDGRPKRGAYIKPMSTYRAEDEVRLRHASRYRVVGIDEAYISRDGSDSPHLRRKYRIIQIEEL